MRRAALDRLAIATMALAAITIPSSTNIAAQARIDLSGRWTLNRALSQLPKEVGFTEDWMLAGADQQAAAGQAPSPNGGRGRGRSGGNRTLVPFGRQPDSADDAARRQQLTGEVRTPPARLTIVETSDAIVFVDDKGEPRTVHPNGRQEIVELNNVPVAVTATREADRVVVLYDVADGRQLRYTFRRSAAPPRLEADVQFLQRGVGDSITLIYEPTPAVETKAAPGVPTAPGAPTPAVPGEAFNQQPSAEFKGLTTMGIVVEELGSQAVACGLSREAIERAALKRLSDAGFTVRRNSDEDTYLYVNVQTSSLSTGVCVSRYDANINSHTTAKLSYGTAPVLVEVSLLHRGGITGGSSATHGDAVTKALLGTVDQFITRIRNANK